MCSWASRRWHSPMWQFGVCIDMAYLRVYSWQCQVLPILCHLWLLCVCACMHAWMSARVHACMCVCVCGWVGAFVCVVRGLLWNLRRGTCRLLTERWCKGMRKNTLRTGPRGETRPINSKNCTTKKWIIELQFTQHTIHYSNGKQYFTSLHSSPFRSLQVLVGRMFTSSQLCSYHPKQSGGLRGRLECRSWGGCHGRYQ